MTHTWLIAFVLLAAFFLSLDFVACLLQPAFGVGCS
jgi:hypothetical protein